MFPGLLGAPPVLGTPPSPLPLTRVSNDSAKKQRHAMSKRKKRKKKNKKRKEKKGKKKKVKKGFLKKKDKKSGNFFNKKATINKCKYNKWIYLQEKTDSIIFVFIFIFSSFKL